ncbi:hypothetical protein [Sporomusa malonica]|uniref:Activator of Hsp90 ATPase homolog 1-like protein n=1 Tax=Sporomusa malonica TaxID=112901 RepID=A0A1W1Y7Q2_9FIRM|nr:hypothetical protein [Sporomusa malonica]SMC32155.1 hypothetical protein SAMN04488500_10181 [Sporomusa malonica]
MFKGKRLIKRHTMRIGAAVDIVYPLLCPEREKEWVDGWSYEMIYSQSGFAEHGCVWKTNFPEEGEAFWVMVKNNPPCEGTYVKFVPGLMVTELSFVLTNTQSNCTLIDATYTFTGLTEQGNQLIDMTLPTSCEQKLVGLERSLDDYVRKGNLLTKNR